jgi:hypothetical protein
MSRVVFSFARFLIRTRTHRQWRWIVCRCFLDGSATYDTCMHAVTATALTILFVSV